jgi:hypothetical protein
VTAQNLADRFVAAPISKLLQFAADAVIAPAILTGELERKLDNLRLDRWSSDFHWLIVKCPLAFDESAMPTKQGIGFEDQDELLELRLLQSSDMLELLDQG